MVLLNCPVNTGACLPLCAANSFLTAVKMLLLKGKTATNVD